MKNSFLFLAQILVIWAIYKISESVVDLFNIPIPASVFGMLFLYVLMSRGMIKVKYIEKGALFFNKHLAFFLLPFAVGLMNYGGLIKTSGLQLLLMIVGSTLIGLIITAGIPQYYARKEKSKQHGQSNSI